ncbi:MAG: YiiX/YebB-like N1pC/P60 family cysteine hydrolase [Verrucomicrobiales bacterium]|nr:YiiX/YebB-like N1pC/P60 family cysteine hydrolase [Verrucomicrobiales bacterium]
MIGRVVKFCVIGVGRLLVWCFYSTIRISGREKIPDDGPVLLVANHANVLIDPLILGMVVNRQPRYLARMPRLRNPLVARLLNWLGVIPLFAQKEVPGQVEPVRTLVEGGVLGVFPEGQRHDRRQLGRVFSGVARIIADAVERGAEDLKIVPIGINYDGKQLFRSVVWVEVGEVIDAREVTGGWASPEEVRRSLAGEIGAGLRRVVIHVDDVVWEPFLEDLEILDPALGTAGGDAVFSLRQRKIVADSLNYFGEHRPAAVESIGRALVAHRARLRESGLTVRSEVLRVRGWRRIVWQVWRTLAVGFGLGPVVAGTLHNGIPVLVEWGITRLLLPPGGDSSRAMARLLVGLPVFLLWYGFVWWLIGLYFLPWVAWCWVISMPLAGLYALRFWRGSREVLRAWWCERCALFRRPALAKLRDRQLKLRERIRVLSDEYSAHRPAATERRPAIYRHPVLRRAVLAGGAGGLVVFVLVCVVRVGVENPMLPELRAPAVDFGAMSAGELASKIGEDEVLLEESLASLAGLEARIGVTDAGFLEGERSSFRDTDTDAIRRLMLSYLNHRNELLRLIWNYRVVEAVEDGTLRLRASMLGLTAGCALYQYALKFTSLFEGRAAAVRTLNEAEPAWGIPPGLFDTVEKNLKNGKNLAALEAALAQYRSRSGMLAESGLLELERHRQFDAFISGTELEKVGSMSAAAAVLDEAGQLVGRTLYDGQAFVSVIVGNTRVREREHGPLVTVEQVEEMRGLLRPGDILIERQDWFLSRAFMPGYWAHAAIYVGDADDLRELGVDGHEWVAPHWDAYVRASEAGEVHNVLEAVPQGVRMTTLEQCVGVADSAAVLRPRKLGEEEVRKMIVRAFRHLGKPYDFEFDFFSSDKLVCTELVFRAYSEVSGISFELVDVLGRQTLPPTEIVRKFADEFETEQQQLDLVLFLDGHAQRGSARSRGGRAFAETVDRPNLTWLNAPD